MNVVKSLIARIEETRKENKVPCKSYGSEAAAEKVAVQVAQEAADYFAINRHEPARPCRYIVVFDEAWGRWVIGFDLSELMGRNSSSGGYVGILSQRGFYTY